MDKDEDLVRTDHINLAADSGGHCHRWGCIFPKSYKFKNKLELFQFNWNQFLFLKLNTKY